MSRGVSRRESTVRKAGKMVEDRLPELIDAMTALALGVKVQSDNRKGEGDVYQKPPDRQSVEYLIDMVIKGAGKRAEEEAQSPPVKIVEVVKTYE